MYDLSPSPTRPLQELSTFLGQMEFNISSTIGTVVDCVWQGNAIEGLWYKTVEM